MLFRLSLFLATLLLIPFLGVLWLALLFLNLVHVLFGQRRKSIPPENSPRSGLASIVVLNWNGRDLLAEGLPSILKAVRVDGRAHEILVVDNGSSDGSLEYLKENFPGVRVLA